MVRWFVLIVAVYIAADVVSPQMPGAVVFDPTESVDLRQSGSFWANDDAMPPVPSAALRIEIALVEPSARPSTLPGSVSFSPFALANVSIPSLTPTVSLPPPLR